MECSRVSCKRSREDKGEESVAEVSRKFFDKDNLVVGAAHKLSLLYNYSFAPRLHD